MEVLSASARWAAWGLPPKDRSDRTWFVLTTNTTSCAGPPSWRTDTAEESAESPTTNPCRSSASVTSSPAARASSVLS